MLSMYIGKCTKVNNTQQLDLLKKPQSQIILGNIIAIFLLYVRISTILNSIYHICSYLSNNEAI